MSSFHFSKLLIILAVTTTFTFALTEEEQAAALELAIGASSSTILRFERICGTSASREERLTQLEAVKNELLKSFAEVVDGNLSPTEKRQFESIRQKIATTIMDDYVKICSGNETPQERLEKLKTHAEMFMGPKSTFMRKTKFSNCKWFGTAPFCSGKCPDKGDWWFNVHDKEGDGKRCLTGQKALCCN